MWTGWISWLSRACKLSTLDSNLTASPTTQIFGQHGRRDTQQNSQILRLIHWPFATSVERSYLIPSRSQLFVAIKSLTQLVIPHLVLSFSGLKPHCASFSYVLSLSCDTSFIRTNNSKHGVQLELLSDTALRYPTSTLITNFDLNSYKRSEG